MARIGVFICWCGENIARTVDVERVAQAGGRAARRALRAELQVHVLGPGPGDDPRENRVREAGRRGGGLLLAAHAPADLPQDCGQRGSEPLPAGDGQHPRALLLGAPRPRTGDRKGDRYHLSFGRQGQKQSRPAADQAFRSRGARWWLAGELRAFRRRSTLPMPATKW